MNLASDAALQDCLANERPNWTAARLHGSYTDMKGLLNVSAIKINL